MKKNLRTDISVVCFLAFCLETKQANKNKGTKSDDID